MNHPIKPVRVHVGTVFEKLGARLGAWIVTHAYLTIGVALACFAIASIGLRDAKFSTDYRIFFSKEDPGLRAFQKLESVFTKTDNVLLVIKAKNGEVFAADPLEAVQDLTTAAWKLPYATRVDSLTNFQHASSSGDDIAVAELVARPAKSLTADELSLIKRTATSEPILLGSLLAKDLTTTAVNITIRLPGKAPEEVAETAKAARALVAAVQARHPNLDIRVSGMAIMNDAFMQASVKDLSVMMPIMVIVMLGGILLVTRRFYPTLSVGLIIGLSAVLTMAFAGWMKYPLSPPCVAAPMIVLTVAVADGVHIVLAVMTALREGKSKRDAITDSLRHNLEAITYTWLTTIVGFICLNYSDAPPVRHLANMTCIGVTVAFVYSFTLLPALLVVLPIGAAPAPKSNSFDAKFSAAMVSLANVVMKYRTKVLVGACVLTIGAGALASQLETNDQFVNYFDSSIPFRRDADFTIKNLSGIYRIEFQVGSDGEQGIFAPTYLQSLEGFAVWLRSQPEVEHVYSFTDIEKRVNQVMHNDAAAEYKLPADRATAAQDLLVYEMSLPAGLDLRDRVSVDKSSTRLSITAKDLSTKQLTGFARRAEGWLHYHAAPSMWSEASGPVVVFSALSERNAVSMVRGDFLSLLLISACMIVVLRSVKLGLLSILPNVVPIIVGYAIWKLFVGQMNIVASVAGSISLGIIVDDTIHFLTRYKNACNDRRLSPEDGMRDTLAHVGPAMIGTSVILVLGFGVLCFSSFQMTSYLGWLSVIIVGIAPLVDLVLAPALIVAFTGKREQAAAQSANEVATVTVAATRMVS
jgi:uncharacterized protein